MSYGLNISKLVISSNGSTVLNKGGYLGEYGFGGEHGGKPYYVQLDDVGRNCCYIFSDVAPITPCSASTDSNPFNFQKRSPDKKSWYVGYALGDIRNSELYTSTSSDTDTVPKHGWGYQDYWQNFYVDPTIIITQGPLAPCGVIDVTLEEKFFDYGGKFKPTSQFSKGRRIYKNQNNKLLYVYGGEWHIGDNSNDWGEIRSKKWEEGGGAPNCAAKVSKWSSRAGNDTNVKLSCTNHLSNV